MHAWWQRMSSNQFGPGAAQSRRVCEGLAGAVAVGVIDSDANALVTDQAVLNVGGVANVTFVDGGDPIDRLSGSCHGVPRSQDKTKAKERDS